MPERQLWLDRLDETISNFSEPVFLVAHSCGSVVSAQWLAERYVPSSPVVGALLVAPADVENPSYLPIIGLQAPLPHSALPLNTLVLASSNDPHCTVERSKQLAQEWGSSLKIIDGGGHLASHDGYGQWPEIVQLLEHQSGQMMQKL